MHILTTLILGLAAILPALIWGYSCFRYVHPAIRAANLVIPSIVAAIYIREIIQNSELLSQSWLNVFIELIIIGLLRPQISRMAIFIPLLIFHKIYTGLLLPHTVRGIAILVPLIILNEIYSLITRTEPLGNAPLPSQASAMALYFCGAIFYTIAIIRFAIFATPPLPSTIAQISLQ